MAQQMGMNMGMGFGAGMGMMMQMGAWMNPFGVPAPQQSQQP